MAKGGKQPGAGRPPGVPNKVTANARAAIGVFVEGNVDRLNDLLDQIEEVDGPQAAWDCIVDVLEYHVPKLARTELVGDEKKPIAHKDVTDIKSKLLKAIPEDQLNAIIATAGNNDG